MRIGLIREGKKPFDQRVAIAPESARKIKEHFNELEIVCQSSPHRCFSDLEYTEAGVTVLNNVDDCDVLLGVKEVPIEALIPGKTYCFFSHTIKAQDYNRDLLQAILSKRITLIDYECLTNASGNRLLAFGRYAGIVGAYNTIWAFGKRYRLFNISRAKDCFDLQELKLEFTKVNLPAIKIVLTGGGRVAKGAMEVLNDMGIRRISPQEFLDQNFAEPSYVQLNIRDYHTHKDGQQFSRAEFFANPENYQSTFLNYANRADILIAGAYWDPRAPMLFTNEDVLKPDFKIKVIGDITCDIEGSIPSTKRASTIDDPLYDYNPSDDRVEQALSDEANLTVMSIDNLPGELPRDASRDFGEDFIKNVLPSLLEMGHPEIIARATIATEGMLTDSYNYLQDFVDEI